MGLVGELRAGRAPRRPSGRRPKGTESAAEPGPEGTVDVGLVDGHSGEPAELPLELVLEVDEEA